MFHIHVLDRKNFPEAGSFGCALGSASRARVSADYGWYGIGYALVEVLI